MITDKLVKLNKQVENDLASAKFKKELIENCIACLKRSDKECNETCWIKRFINACIK